MLIKRNSFFESELVGIEQIKTKSDKNRHNYCEILKAYDYVKKELEAEKDSFKLWNDAGKTVNAILNHQSLYQTASLGFNEEEDKNKKPISFLTPVQFVKPGGEPVKDKVLNIEKVSNIRNSYDKVKEVNVGNLSKSQLKKKLDILQESRFLKRNRNGKVGINKANDYKHLPNAPRKICHKCGNKNHLAINCKLDSPKAQSPKTSESKVTNL